MRQMYVSSTFFDSNRNNNIDNIGNEKKMKFDDV
jgi:hypothetical protein